MDRPPGILVELNGKGTLGREEALVAACAEEHRIPLMRASVKQLERTRVKVLPGYVAVGSVSFVHHALRQLGRPLPEPAPYPPVLAPLLYRRVRKLKSLREARHLLLGGTPLFIKPAASWKRFTGFVPASVDDPRFNGASDMAPVWVSEVVRFVSEWRAYVADDTLLDVRFAEHGGDRSALPDRAVIENAVQTLAGVAPAGYVIDFGVLDSGQTALVEVNDGFAFGAYDGVSAEVYWKVTVRRWRQLTA